MADAEVGDDAYGEDPTVHRLESLAAALLGKEAALFVPSGTMANQLALRVARRGPAPRCSAATRAHVYRYEHAACRGERGRAAPPARPTPTACCTADDDRRAPRRGRSTTCPPISALCIENTHMPARGRPWRAAELDAVDRRVARAHGLAVHCDGARIWNAADRARRVAGRRSSAGADTVMFCLSKGLGAPVGSLLCGHARRDRPGARAPGPARAAGCARRA